MDFASCDRKWLRMMCRKRCFEKCRRMVHTSQTSSMRPRRMVSSASSRAKTCTLLRSTPQEGASRSRGSTRVGWPNTTAGAPETKAEDRRCRSSRGSTPTMAASGSGEMPAKQTFRVTPSKHSKRSGCNSAHMSKYFLNSPVLLVESATRRIPGISGPTSPRVPRTSADVLPHCGAPWIVMNVFCSSVKADMTSGTTRLCISSGLSKPHCRRSWAICSPICWPSLLKSERKSLSTSMLARASSLGDSVKTSIWLPSRTVILESRDDFSSVDVESLLRVLSEIVERKLSSRLPLCNWCLGCLMPLRLPLLARGRAPPRSSPPANRGTPAWSVRPKLEEAAFPALLELPP
mmetsp:Transcript_20726/g.65371  ORF Transcript_20726/g.65371 Transcript_20726/m.65371 type:complete len:348 (-) Transcript_20726:151-1194(-)